MIKKRLVVGMLIATFGIGRVAYTQAPGGSTDPTGALGGIVTQV